MTKHIEIKAGTPPEGEGATIVDLACEELVARGYKLYKGEQEITDNYR
jgi:hypothetical protein